MRLAVSNLAWSPSENGAVARTLGEMNIDAVELAPTKVFRDDPLNADLAEVASVKRFWRNNGITIVALQSLLYGRPDLSLFADGKSRAEIEQRLSGYLQLAAHLGAARLVFGSPVNRRVPDDMSPEVAIEVAVEMFSQIGAEAERLGVVLCIEPNPGVYGCNFVTDSHEGAALVKRVGSAGFGLHLDVAGMTLQGENVANGIVAAGRLIRHFHISAPELGPLEDTLVDHAAAASALQLIGYSGYVSIEMRPAEQGENLRRVVSAVQFARRYYSMSA